MVPRSVSACYASARRARAPISVAAILRPATLAARETLEHDRHHRQTTFKYSTDRQPTRGKVRLELRIAARGQSQTASPRSARM